ncbi:MAG TPA: signal peptidase II [Acidimicrobiales bacterium]|nr:signal peptidase II [Acidimicrobiales bacterium]
MQERGTVPALSGAAEAEPARRRAWRRGLVAAATLAAVVGFDQLTKTLAERRLARGPIDLLGPIRLALTYNTGAAFGLGKGSAPVLVAGGVVVVVFVVRSARRSDSTAAVVATSLVVGGAAGNLVDRLIRHNAGAVIDFVDLRIWPVFNLADACVVCGAALLVIALRRASP